MIELHPHILERDGKPSFVVLPYEEFVALQDGLQDALDSLAIEETVEKNKGKRRFSLAEVQERLAVRGRSGKLTGT